jgi:hypothetical protein
MRRNAAAGRTKTGTEIQRCGKRCVWVSFHVYVRVEDSCDDRSHVMTIQGRLDIQELMEPDNDADLRRFCYAKNDD